MSSEWLSVTDNDAVVPWSIGVDGFFRKSVESRMIADGMTEEAIDSIFNNATRILGRCPNPNIQEEVAETGIVIGKVQSGKTSNFISVLALAFDNGYDIAIVLGGNTLNLLKQNAFRISNAFSVDAEKLTVLKTNDNKTLINPARIKDFIENGRKVIIVGLKHNKHIDQIAEIFDNEFLADKSVLIVDDEGDQATLNTRAYQQSISTTYASVLNLKSKLKSHCFLSITATPQANIFIEAFDTLSPDFGELVYPGEGYCGLQEFHGEDADRYIKEIPESEPNLLDSVGVPESVCQAMALFFVGNAIRRSRGDMGIHAMLIHPSQKKFDHRVVEQKIQSILEDWKIKAKTYLAGKKDISYISLRMLLKMAYDSFVADGVACYPFDDLEKQILDIINQCSPVLICNSEENASENAELFKTNIFVGGNLVERGITFKGLAVTYITRRAKGKSNVDNTEQRARWFGYKAKYLDVCRVFTTKDIKDDFASILEHDEDMWASIERAQERGTPFKDMPRIFKFARSAYLNLTRQNVARTENFALSEWKPQRYFTANDQVVSKNTVVIAAYRSKYEGLLIEQRHNHVQVHRVLENQRFEQVYSELLSKLQFANNELLDSKYFAKLNEALIKLQLDVPVDVYWIRDIDHSTRKIREDYTIQQLFQGRNPNTSSSLYYDGDRSLADNEPDHIQLQIHFVKPTNMPEINYYAPVLALYVPESCAIALSELVVRAHG